MQLILDNPNKILLRLTLFFREPAGDLRVIVLRGGKMSNTRIHIDGFEAGSVKPEKKN
jgi:hypothetical protein